MSEGETPTGEMDGSSPPARLAEENLKPSFQEALSALRERHTPAIPVGRHEGEIAVWLGEFDFTVYQYPYTPEQAEVYIFLPENFVNSDPHWVMTVPPVERADREGWEDNNPDRRDQDKYLQNDLGVDQGITFSLRWSHLNFKPEKPEHAVRAIEVIDAGFETG
ncbi:hypothetical protein N0B31_21750 (plasmid) [Salinirubellus salinus]|uniref:Uncharacterized protein n=1 Tax=Salinirubellus salinus TaxID=1364945 RepID=A0A9E7R6Y8_9EURY|nr:hypothetical protein [Salinirubellus salinus]UWM57066.1 hypothetical protein N0B31_21750 [Salinirubellus salinus]